MSDFKRLANNPKEACEKAKKLTKHNFYYKERKPAFEFSILKKPAKKPEPKKIKIPIKKPAKNPAKKPEPKKIKIAIKKPAKKPEPKKIKIAIKKPAKEPAKKPLETDYTKLLPKIVVEGKLKKGAKLDPTKKWNADDFNRFIANNSNKMRMDNDFLVSFVMGYKYKNDINKMLGMIYGEGKTLAFSRDEDKIIKSNYSRLGTHFRRLVKKYQ